ncbi:MAG: hypothetical protein KR126chlam6_00554 [Candidatus Anoxychlamydiales bacterium]|nr:hypothetical protein [Candidatus Anoxychlamydiales bacterium]
MKVGNNGAVKIDTSKETSPLVDEEKAAKDEAIKQAGLYKS